MKALPQQVNAYSKHKPLDLDQSQAYVGAPNIMLKFGVRLLGSLGDTAALQKLGVVAEESGFDSCWFAHDPFQSNSWVTAVAVAAATKKIAIGLNFKPYTIDPSEIATLVAGLDEFSRGRVILGIGSHTDVMYDWIGLRSRNLTDLTREAVHLIQGLLSGNTMEYHGKLFQWSNECYLRFSPLRSRVPVYIPGFGKEMFELSGEIGDGSLPMATPPESFDYPVKYVLNGARKAGRQPGSVDCVGLIWIYVSKDGYVDEKALKRVISYFIPYLEEEMISRVGVTRSDVAKIAVRLAQRDYEGAAEQVTSKMLDLAVYGTPDDCIKRIEALQQKGATSVSIGGPLGRNPEEAIRVLGREVISYFKDDAN